MAKPVWAYNDIPTATQFNEWLTNINFARKSATESVSNSLTLQDDNELLVPIEANAIYLMDSIILYDGPANADLKILFRTPTGGSMSGAATGLLDTASTAGNTVTIPITGNSSNSFGTLGSGTQALICHGMVFTSGTAGNLQVEWSQNTSQASATRVISGSWINLRRVS